MTQRMAAGFLTGRLMVNYILKPIDKIYLNFEPYLLHFRSFKYQVHKVSNGSAGRQVKAKTKELEAIYQGNSYHS